MQLRALIELSGYCETRNSFLHRTLHKTFSIYLHATKLFNNILSRICGTEY
jgi:hypothetical protein